MAKAKRTAHAHPKAFGRDAIRDAVIAAARELFAEKGYAAVGMREIAAAAGVNQGLIHRHFGAKSEVLQAVLQDMFSDVGGTAMAQLDPASPDFIVKLFPIGAKRKMDWMILMRAVLDGYDFQQGGFSFPITGAVLAHASARRGKRDRETRKRAAAVIAGGIGWLLLQDYLAPILELESEDRDKLLVEMSKLYQTLIEVA